MNIDELMDIKADKQEEMKRDAEYEYLLRVDIDAMIEHIGIREALYKASGVMSAYGWELTIDELKEIL